MGWWRGARFSLMEDILPFSPGAIQLATGWQGGEIEVRKMVVNRARGTLVCGLVSLFAMSIQGGCTKKEPGHKRLGSHAYVDSEKAGSFPTDPLEFRRFLMETMPEELHATVCQCCNKSLYQCFEETLSPPVKACPDT